MACGSLRGVALRTRQGGEVWLWHSGMAWREEESLGFVKGAWHSGTAWGRGGTQDWSLRGLWHSEGPYVRMNPSDHYPLDYFQQLWPNSLVDVLVTETNRPERKGCPIGLM